MPLTKPALVNEEPGRPITAQGWNAIVDAIGALFDAVLAIGSGTLTVSVQSGGQPVTGATVIAEPVGEGQPVRGLPLFGDRTTYLVPGVSDGAWRVHVSAPGYTTVVLDTNVPQTAPLAVNLAHAGAVVPDLFGMPLQGSINALRAVDVEIDVIIDALGKEISRTQVPAEYQNAAVLVQLPDAGAVIDPATTRVRLVVAAAVREEPIVALPSLVGLTQAEAATALSAVGLRLGKVTVR